MDDRGSNHLRSSLNDDEFYQNCHDLPELLDNTQSPPHINFYYGQGNTKDKVHADHLSTSAHVSIYAVNHTKAHCVLPGMCARNKFDQIMTDLFRYQSNS